MIRYKPQIINRVKRLRSLGKTYSEIKENLQLNIPKSTLSDWCKDITLPPEYLTKISELNEINRHRGRVLALIANKIKREKALQKMIKINTPIAVEINNNKVAKIALAMLCLGEASKSKGGATNLFLGNSDPRIIKLFINLIKVCYSFNLEKVRCTIQCRADQNVKALELFWQQVTGIPKRLFYRTRIDPRTIGKPTKRKEYKGVLRVDYFDNQVWLDLETLADLVYNNTAKNGPEV